MKGLISIVVPAYNEEDVLPVFHRRLSAVLHSLPYEGEIIYVNDGSTDHTLGVLQKLRESDRRMMILDLSRNFGKEIALTAGLDYARGNGVVVIDADLQDPPELIPELISHWEAGYDVVYSKRLLREGEGAVKKGTADLFYKLMQRLGPIKIPENTGDFRLLSRRAVDALKQLREQHRFMKGLFTWIGYPQKAVLYQRAARLRGKTKWSYRGLWNLALEGITSFSIVPLKMATYVGLSTSFLALLYAAVVFFKALFYGDPVKGYPSLMVVILFLGGVQLLSIGVLGEYLGRVFDETKGRPLYFVKDFFPSDSAGSNHESECPPQRPDR